LPARDLDLLTQAALQAGDIARRYWRADPKVWEKGKDGPVSEADFEVDAYLRQTLRAERPAYGWLSEETEDSRSNRADTMFVVDPIDGTRAFIAGESTWAHSIAVVQGGKPVAGVVYLPVHEKLYAGALGHGATLNGAQIAASERTDLEGASFLANKAAFEPGHWRGASPEVVRAFRPSLAYRMALVAEGRFDGMLTLRPTWEWDIAAGAIIATEAGARVGDRSGHDLRFNNADPRTDGMLAAGAALFPEIVRRLA
jgi:myo-inositol-1(or 4)-monophosphatase